MANRQAKDPEGAEKIELELPLPKEGRGSEKWWRDQIEQSLKRLKKEIPNWRLHYERYQSERPKLGGIRLDDVVPVQTDYYNTEQKKGQLFFQTPILEAQSKDGQPPGDGVPQLARLVNYFQGADEIDCEALMDSILFDVICPSGIGVVCTGYEEKVVQIEQPVLEPVADPADPTGVAVTMQPKIDPVTNQPVLEKVPQRIWRRFFHERVSATGALIPATWTSQEYDKAPWLGYRVAIDPDSKDSGDVARSSRVGGGNDEFSISPKNDREFIRDSNWQYTLFYRAAWLDPTVQNPEIFRRIVLRDAKRGEATVIKHDMPYQRVGPNGALVKGMRGNPITIYSLRAVADTSFPKSDCAHARSSADEISTGRSQMVIQRKRNLPLRAFNRRGMTKSQIQQIQDGEIQGLIGMDGDPEKLIRVIAQASLPQENFQFNTIAMNDNRATWGLGANAQALREVGGVTATEIGEIARATDDRLVKERNRVLRTFTKMSGKLSELIQLFADAEMVTPILGEADAGIFMATDWAARAGRFRFTLLPDSSVRVDASEDFERDLRTYNLVGRDPYFDRRGILRKMAMSRSLPGKTVLDTLPQAGPEKPRPTISIPANMLSLPASVELLAQYGIMITPVSIPGQLDGSQPGADVPAGDVTGSASGLPLAQHPGAMEQVEPISKHEADRSGRRPGPATR